MSQVSLSACDSGGGRSETMAGEVIEARVAELSPEELLDPVSCRPCHPNHYDEWAASMHAYASDDPVFRAMNQRGQRESDGALGSFCVQCHAPIATRLELTEDGLNLDELPQHLRGVTCAFCHQVKAVEGTHNNPLSWSADGVMRGPLSELAEGAAHRSAYSPHLDRSELSSSALCGSCHDIVTPSGLHLERTFWEWERSIFNDQDPRFRNTCNDCHMPRRPNELSSVSGAPLRRRSDHLMPGVDIHLTEHPGRERMREAVLSELRYSLLPELCAQVSDLGGGEIELTLENIAAGHRFPSGAALDRRLWVELSVFDADHALLWQSGMIGPDEPVAEAENTWLLRDRAFNAEGLESHLFWELESAERNTLPGPQSPRNTGVQPEQTHVMRSYRFGTARAIARIELRVWMRPMGLEILRGLVSSGDLNPALLDELPTLELEGASRMWSAELATPQVTRSGRTLLCVP